MNTILKTTTAGIAGAIAGALVMSADLPDAQHARETREYRVAMAAYRAEHPACEWCGARPVEVHHVRPVSQAPDLAASTNNMISLCAKRCHFVLGHRCNWMGEVTNVREIVQQNKEAAK